MNIVLDLNARQCAVKQLKTDDKSTGLAAGMYVVAPEIYEKLKDFLNSQAEKVKKCG